MRIRRCFANYLFGRASSAFCRQGLARLTGPGLVVVSSDLARMEALVKPLRNNDAALVQNFDSFFAIQVTYVVPFNESIFRRAAEIRAGFSVRTPDTLHLAAALEAACDVFLTSDAQLKSFNAIAVEVVT